MMYELSDPRVYEALIPKNPLLDAQDWNALNVRFVMVPPNATPPQSDWRRVYHAEVDIYENSNAAPRVSFASHLESMTSELAQIRIEKYISGHIEIIVDAPQAGWLIVRERLYPGWRATINSQRAELREAQGLWQAVAVPAGNSVVVLEFRPSSVTIGAGLTGLGLVLVAAAFACGAKNRDPEGQT